MGVGGFAGGVMGPEKGGLFRLEGIFLITFKHF